MTLVNGIQTDTLPVSDRGLHYGDGVFETIAIKQKQAQFLVSHLDRLKRGCTSLLMPLPDMDVLKSEITSLTETVVDKAVLKIIITRGSGGRGYRPEAVPHVTRILSLHPWGDHIDVYREQGIQLMLCKTHLAHNPQLAGFKHLNRLEQVIASAELTDDFQEGIMQDIDGAVIEGTMSNIFIIADDKTVKTPRLDQCGIQGIMRHKLLKWLQNNNFNVDQTNIGLSDLLQAQSILMSNSIIGLWPVNLFKARQETRHYSLPGFVEDFNKYLDTAR
jgi:4-amino-4-deoxychorismate lyase